MSSAKPIKTELGAHSTPATMGQAQSTGGAPKSACCGKMDWDLHPNMIRQIENKGSPADVQRLHEMERECPRRAEHQQNKV
ncbi:hypothetical protein BGX29_010619 [Mortierella sp. GBA35]|nr:hypothetical protein BGX29_010619 [Mortierella sp. GBA35]